MTSAKIAHIFFLLLFFAACRKDSLVPLPVFRELPSPVAGDFSAVWMFDSLRGTAVGGEAWESGFILSTDDGGLTWRADTLMGRKMESVMFDRDGQGYVCGQDCALFRQPGAQYWQVMRTNYEWNKAVFFSDGRSGVIASGGGYLGGRITSFGPEAFWQLDTMLDFPNALADVWFSDSVTAHAVGIGWVLRSGDAGHSWERGGATGDFFQSVHFPTPAVGYVCGSSGTVLKTSDGGLSWKIMRRGGTGGKRNQPFRALWFVNADTGFIAGDDGLFWRTDDGGSSWAQVQNVPSDADFTDIFVRDGRGWAVAKSGRIFYFEH